MVNKYLALQKDVFDINKVTVVGSPTITSDGVASGFSTGNYIDYPITVNTTNLRIKGSCIYKFDADLGQQRVVSVIGGNSTTTTANVYLILTTTGFIFDGDVNGTWKRFANLPIKTFTDGDVIDFDITLGLNYQIYNFTVNGEIYNYTTNLELSTFSGYKVVFSYHGAGYSFAGSINLKDFKIYADNQLIYTPTKPAYLLERRKPKVWNKGQFTVVGNPSISDSGVASGFSKTSYIEIPNTNLQNADTWEVEGVVQVFSQGVQNDKAWLAPTSGNGIMLPVACEQGNTNVQYQLYLSSSNTSWNIASDNSIKFPSGSRVKCNLKFTGTQYIYTCTNLDTGEVKQIIKNSTLKIYQSPTRLGCKRNTSPLTTNDSIDLKQFKIYTDNTLVFDGGADTYVYDPSKFTVVGSPTITEYGVASGFTTSNYINIANQVSYTLFQNTDWEVRCQFKNYSSSDIQCLFQMFTDNAPNSVRVQDNKVWCSLMTSAYSEKTLNTILVNGNDYIVSLKHEKQSGKNILSLYDKNGKFLEANDTFLTGDLVFQEYNYTRFYIGCGISAQWAFQGSINLPSISVTIDGKEVFTGAKENYYMLRR